MSYDEKQRDRALISILQRDFEERGEIIRRYREGIPLPEVFGYEMVIGNAYPRTVAMHFGTQGECDEFVKRFTAVVKADTPTAANAGDQAAPAVPDAAQHLRMLEVVVSGTPILVEVAMGQDKHALASIRGEALATAGISITSGEWRFTDEDGTVLDGGTPLSDVKTRIFLSRSAGIVASPDVRPSAAQPQKPEEPQVMGRVHNDRGQGEAWLNSVGRQLPDNTPLYAAPVAAQPPEAIGEVRENGVYWFNKNPHAHPLGTQFYAVQPAQQEPAVPMTLVTRNGSPYAAYPRRIQAEVYASGFYKSEGLELVDGSFVAAASSAPSVSADKPDASAGGQPWMRVEGNCLFISRCDWIYPQATEDDAGPRDEARCKAIGQRTGDIVLHFNGASLDAQDLATMLTYTPAATSAAGQKPAAWACIVDGAWHVAFKHELDAKEAGFATGKRFDLLPLIFDPRPTATNADAVDAKRYRFIRSMIRMTADQQEAVSEAMHSVFPANQVGIPTDAEWDVSIDAGMNSPTAKGGGDL